MATAEEVERFISEQKSKLAHERDHLDKRPPQAPNRPQNGYPPTSKEPNRAKKGGQISPRPLPRGSYEQVRNRLNEERRQEYNKTQERKLDAPGYPMDEGSSIPGLKERNSAKLRMRQQRNQEYNDYLRQKEEQNRRRRALRGGGQVGAVSEPDVSPKASGQLTLQPSSRLGQVNTQPSSRPSRRTPFALDFEDPVIDKMVSTNPITHEPQDHTGFRDDQKVDYRKPTKDEYSQTNQPYYEDRGQPLALPPPPPRDQGRDLTFGERPLPPRQGWRTPLDNYDELLRRKREDEARYRQYQDDPYYARQGGLRPAYSDPHIRKSFEDDDRLTNRRLDHLDQEYDVRKVRFRDEAIRGGVYSQSNVADRPNYRDPPPPRDDRDSYNWGESSLGRRRSFGEADRPGQSDVRPGARSAPIDDAGTGLNIGVGSTASAQQRKKEQYRRDLEQQMAEAREAKRREKQREKQSELAVNATGEIDPEKYPDRLRNLPPQEGKALPTTIGASQGGGLSLRDRVEPAPNLGLSKAYARSQPSSYIEQPLDLGAYPTSQMNPNDPYVYYGMRDPLDPETAKTPLPMWLQSSTAPAAGTASVPPLALQQQQQQLQAQQQLFQQNGPAVTGPHGVPPIYTKGPVVANGLVYPAGTLPGVVPMVPAGSSGVAGIPGAPGVSGSIYAPRGPELTKQDTASLRGDSSILNYVGDENLSPRNKKIDPKSYQQELLEQMKENEYKKKKARAEEDAYNRRLEEEARDYNPWGKGGGGAPMKDVKGNIVADLRQLHGINEEGLADPSRKQLYARAAVSPDPSPRPSAFADDSKPTYGRGKIFNDDPAEVAQQKTAQDAYKEFLQRQVEEKKKRDEEEKERLRLEEEREARRLEEQRLQMQKEFEAEQEKAKKKEEEARLRNEELAKQAEENRREAERRRREEDDKKQDEMRRLEEEERNKRQAAEAASRVASPPIPTLRKKDKDATQIPAQSQSQIDPDDRPIKPGKEDIYSRPLSKEQKEDSRGRQSRRPRRDTQPSADGRSVSPPLPAQRSRVGDNQDVIQALSAMRRQLRDEQSRIQQQLHLRDDHTRIHHQLQDRQYDSYDPPDSRYRRRTPQVDVFEMARNKEAVYPRKQATPANPQNLSEFTDLKNKGGRSRQEFRHHYPEQPSSNSVLEAQQNALIQQQEEKLEAIRRGRTNTERDMPGMRPSDLGRGIESPSMPLPSESAFVNANTGETEIPSSPIGYKPSSARQRRRVARDSPSPKQADPMGSVTSFDVDTLAKKNRERLENLKRLEDGDSLADPDEVLKRFMNKSSHDRPPSATSQDAWLRPSAVDA